MATAPPVVDATLRPLRTLDERKACLALQYETWGEDFSDFVSPILIQVAQKVGGVAAGAFGPNDELLGFVFGLTGVQSGRMIHWSHMLSVRQDSEGRGLGRRLKAFQREQLLSDGIDVAYWTFDPLFARNAHFNLTSLGAAIAEYVPNMYGEDTGSPLHSGIGTDRFVAEWQLANPAVDRVPSINTPSKDSRNCDVPVAAPEDIRSDGALSVKPPAVRITIPSDIKAVRERSVEEAMRWRQKTRQLFQAYMANGYHVAEFHRSTGAEAHYIMKI